MVAEGSLALAIGIAGERAGALAAQARHVPEAADRVVGADAADEAADRLAADVRQRRAGTDVAPRDGPGGAGLARRSGYVLSSVGIVALPR